MLSATCGSLITADDGSRYGTRGTSTSPAPSIPRRPDDRDEPVRVLPVRVVPVVPVPPVAADGWSGGEPHSSQYPSTIVPEQPGWRHLPSGGAEPADGPGGGACAAGAAAAEPHSSQYPSTIVPAQPGWAQAFDAPEPDAGEPDAGDGLGAAGGMPHMTQ
ncbi:hypothetical protein [Actinomadura verrucosospora]|uniref:hypothetical protein n=1 Tax=Actinomadura verrucosospora TaxID=46165 RepID=UPI001FE53544|nr:hypothetical protein [Actinomadura verrucosospora]